MQESLHEPPSDQPRACILYECVHYYATRYPTHTQLVSCTRSEVPKVLRMITPRDKQALLFSACPKAWSTTMHTVLRVTTQ